MFRKLVLLALCGGVATAGAADNGLYLGVGATQSSFDLPTALDDKDNGFKAILGFRALDSLGLELNYADHGKVTAPTGIFCVTAPCPTSVSLSAKTTSGFVVGFAHFPLLDFFGKAGVASWKAESNLANSPAFSFNETGTDFAWGAGVQAHFGSLGARAEFEQFKYVAGQKLDVVSVSLLYTFL